MQKIIGLLLILGMAVTAVAIPNITEAAESDTFTITVTVSYLEIALRNIADAADFTTWDLATKAVNTITTMESAEGILVEVGNSSAYKLTGQITGACDWTAGDSDTTSADTYLLAMQGAATAACPEDMTVAGDATAIVITTPADITNATGAAATGIFLYGAFTTPKTTTSGKLQTITVTIAIAAAS